jgi:hypothetical protein
MADRTIADLAAVLDPVFDSFAEMEPDEDTGEAVLVGGFREAAKRTKHRGRITTRAPSGKRQAAGLEADLVGNLGSLLRPSPPRQIFDGSRIGPTNNSRPRRAGLASRARGVNRSNPLARFAERPVWLGLPLDEAQLYLLYRLVLGRKPRSTQVPDSRSCAASGAEAASTFGPPLRFLPSHA